MRKIAIGTVVLLTAILMPILVQAQSTNVSEAQALLSQISQLQSQIASLSQLQTSSSGSAGVSTPAPSTVAPTVAPTTASSSGVCPNLTHTLSYGSSGSDVANLQAFLSQQGVFNASVTAYFGPVTQVAVGAWQVQEGILPAGSTSASGWGVVGPVTRAAIERACGNTSASASSVSPGQSLQGSQSPACIPVQPPTTDCPTAWQPVTDNAGCTEYYQCSITLPTAGSADATGATNTTAGNAASATCPVVTKPECLGQVETFETGANGCVSAYECIVN